MDLPPELAAAIAKRRKVSLKVVSEITNLSQDTIRRRYAHLIKQLSPRRQGTDLGDALAIGEQSKPAA
jgi:hypothetical protein